MADAAAEAGVDSTTIGKLRAVARDGAIAALQASKPVEPKHTPAESAEPPGPAELQPSSTGI